MRFATVTRAGEHPGPAQYRATTRSTAARSRAFSTRGAHCNVRRAYPRRGVAPQWLQVMSVTVGSHSRPLETVKPMAERLGLVPLNIFTKGEEQQALVREALSR